MPGDRAETAVDKPPKLDYASPDKDSKAPVTGAVVAWRATVAFKDLIH